MDYCVVAGMELRELDDLDDMSRARDTAAAPATVAAVPR
jgi:hypothetical protein